MKNTNKITTLLVDDDTLVLNDLRQLVPWEDLGFTIVGTAGNGKQALKMFKTLRPQLVITDVIMPLKNGIELIQAIKEMEPGTFFLILSSYDEFDYAKSALQLGVVDYLLKTEITAESLSHKLLSVYTNIKSTKKSQRKHQSLELQEYFESPAVSVINQYSLLGTIKNKKFYFFACSVSPLFKRSLLQEGFQVFSNISLEDFSLKMELTDWDLVFQTDHYIFIGLSEAVISSAETSYLNAINSYFLSLKHQVTVFYLTVPQTISDFRKLYRTKKNAMDWYLFFPECWHVRLQSLKSISEQQILHSLLPAYDHFADMLQKENGEETLTHWLSQIQALGNLAELIRLFHYLHNLLHKSPDDTIFYLVTFQAFKAWVLEEYTHWRTPQSEENISYSAHIKNAILYISNNYMKSSLNIEQIAENVGISSGRLSVLFKKELKKTAIEYVTEYRIKMAIHLLMHSNCKIYEIANQVGYNSSQYFSQVFLQYTGRKPLDYRKNTMTTITIGDKP